MTLFKQILLIMGCFQTLILSVIMWLNFNTINDFVKVQLHTDAKHTASSLGLAIKSSESPEDVSMVQTMINSIFDSGYYQLIQFNDIEGKEIIKSYQPVIVKDVPQWFIDLIPLDPPIASSEIMLGWMPYGKLYVQSSAGLAYLQLWSIFLEVGISTICISIIAFICIFFILRTVLRPLKLVRQQAEAILENDFIFQNEIPFTIELKRMILAMNSMIGKVKEIFDKESQTLNQYHNLLYKDDLTSLYNRRYFDLKFNEYIVSDEQHDGCVVMVSLSDTGIIRDTYGYKKEILIFEEVAKSIQDSISHIKDSFAARLGKSDFIFLLPNYQLDSIENLCNDLLSKVETKIKNLDLDQNSIFINIGATNYNNTSKLTSTLSKADFALAMAKSKGQFTLEIDNTDDKKTSLGKEGWRNEINNAIKEDRFIFALQKAISPTKAVEHYEVFLRLRDKKGNIFNAGYFIPMINELNMNEKIDYFVLEKLISNFKTSKLPNFPLSVNLSKEILLDNKGWLQFEKVIKTLKQVSKQKIFFEIRNNAEISIEILSKFSRLLRAEGFGLGIDNFIIDGNSIKIIQEINPTYIKIPYFYLLDLFKEEGESMPTRQSFEVITRCMDVILFAVVVEKEQEKEELNKIGIHSLQGSLVEKPWLINEEKWKNA